MEGGRGGEKDQSHLYPVEDRKKKKETGERLGRDATTRTHAGSHPTCIQPQRDHTFSFGRRPGNMRFLITICTPASLIRTTR